jgi:hypothetical protein
MSSALTRTLWHARAKDFPELRDGMKAMNFTPQINIGEEEWEILSQHNTLCDANGEFDKEQFRAMLEGEVQKMCWSRQECLSSSALCLHMLQLDTSSSRKRMLMSDPT